MFIFAETAKSAGPSPWIFGIVAIIAFALGIVFLIRPRQSSEAWRRITQATRPYRVKKAPVGVSVAFGCLCLFIGAVMFYFAWAFSQR
jgi:hypothetical protein